MRTELWHRQMLELLAVCMREPFFFTLNLSKNDPAACPHPTVLHCSLSELCTALVQMCQEPCSWLPGVVPLHHPVLRCILGCTQPPPEGTARAVWSTSPQLSPFQPAGRWQPWQAGQQKCRQGIAGGPRGWDTSPVL